MKKKVVSVLAIAGLAAMAGAQTAMVQIDAVGLADGASVHVGDTIVWEVTIHFTGGDYVFGANMRFDMMGSGGLSADGLMTAGSSVDLGTVFDGGMLLAAGLDNVSYTDAGRGQLGGAGDNPFVLGSFSTTATGLGDLSFMADKKSAGTTPMLSIGSGGAFVPPFEEDLYQDKLATGFSQMSDTINVVPIPTPGSLALVGLGGLAMARRRR